MKKNTPPPKKPPTPIAPGSVYIDVHGDSLQDRFDDHKVKQVTTIKAHDTFVQCMLILIDGRLATGSRDNTIKIWNLNYRNKCDLVLEGHTSSVSKIIQLKNYKIVSVDHLSLIVWSVQMHSYQQLFRMKYKFHEILICVTEAANNRLFTVSEHHICLWENTSASDSYYYSIKEVKEAQFPGDYYSSILTLYKQNKIAVGSYKTLSFWDAEKFKCETIFTDIDCYGTNSLFQMNPKHLLVGGDGFIYIINVENPGKYKIEKGVRYRYMLYAYCFIRITDTVIMVGSDDGYLYEFNMETNDFKMLINNYSHSRAVFTMIRLKKRVFVTGSFDGLIKIWRV